MAQPKTTTTLIAVTGTTNANGKTIYSAEVKSNSAPAVVANAAATGAVKAAKAAAGPPTSGQPLGPPPSVMGGPPLGPPVGVGGPPVGPPVSATAAVTPPGMPSGLRDTIAQGTNLRQTKQVETPPPATNARSAMLANIKAKANAREARLAATDVPLPVPDAARPSTNSRAKMLANMQAQAAAREARVAAKDVPPTDAVKPTTKTPATGKSGNFMRAMAARAAVLNPEEKPEKRNNNNNWKGGGRRTKRRKTRCGNKRSNGRKKSNRRTKRRGTKRR